MSNPPYHEEWYLKLNDPAGRTSVWLRFSTLVSNDGGKKVAETWGIVFDRDREPPIFARKKTQEYSSFSRSEEGLPRIADSFLSLSRTAGTIDSLRWDLVIKPRHESSFNLIPESLSRLGIVKNLALTEREDLLFTGTVEVDGKTLSYDGAPGMQGHLGGKKFGHSWYWGHCNSFSDESGKPADFVFEGLSARAKLPGGIPSPWLSTFFFRYRDREFRCNTFLEAVKNRAHGLSQNGLHTWTFVARHADLEFRGEASAPFKDFAGVTYEDCDGSQLFCSNCKLSDLEISVYRSGKLESKFRANRSAAFEIVSGARPTEVPILL